MQHHARRADVLESFLLAALVFDEFQNAADVFFVGQDRGEDYRLFDLCDLAGIGPARGVVDFDQVAIGFGDFVAHAGGGGDEFEGELALQALLNDFHVEQAEEAATEAET